MSLLQYISTKKYIVTVENSEDLAAIYDELESLGKTPPGLDITRDVMCIDRRPSSRNTVYLLTEWEAGELARDPRIKSVTLHPKELGISAGLNAYTQASSNWDKSTSTATNMKNWGLLRCTEGTQRASWGGTGYQGNGSGTAAQTGTITLTQTGKNVDVVICDENGLVWNHPEFTANADGSGTTRTNQYNWFQHNLAVKGTSPGTYSYGTGSHSTHVAGTVAGNTQGWARDANIYNLYYLSGDDADYTFPYVFDYIRQFHANKSVNGATGRKNPTIVNNSWGMSIFPSDWALTDITAVTYRGTRYTPTVGATTYLGTSGVCNANSKLADLLGFENFGNRITTSGPPPAGAGNILSFPGTWTQEGGQVYLASLTAPASIYTVTVQGPCTVALISNVASGGITGVTSLTLGVTVTQGASTIATYTQGPTSSSEGGDVELIIDQTVSLPNSAVYTITYNTTLVNGEVASPLTAVAMSTRVTVATGAEAATVSSITPILGSTAGLTVVTTPTSGNNDDGFWNISLPFTVNFLGGPQTNVFPGTNFYLTFGSGSTVWSGVNVANPNLPKIMWCAKDNSVQRIYHGVEGTSPNRTYRIRMEGNASTSGTLGSPGMVCEYTFYEATPAQIDLQVGVNNAKTTSSGFTTEQLNTWGFISGQRIPARVAALDADIEDAIDEGIVTVGAAGNGRWKHDVPGGLDWNNTFEMSIRYPGSVAQPYYYMRGTSPTANDTTANGGFDLPNICVGSVDSIQIDQKVQYSDCGPGVDIWAPGTYIVSSLPSGTADPRSGSHYLGKYSGTSMASPQVAGVLACALEVYPGMTQEQAKAYIVAYAKSGQLTTTSGGPTDAQDLQGAPNKFLYYYQERATSGNTFPKINFKPRPSTGSVYPRTRIRRT
jgi:subtilisin family serine protease